MKEQEFKETELGLLPKEWEVVKLIETANKNSDIVGGPFGSNLKVSDYKNEGIPILRLQNIERNKFIDKDIKYVSEEKAEELKYHSFIANDIILAKLGDPIGKTCIVPNYLKRGIVVADVVRIRTRKEITEKTYIVYALNASFVEEQFRKQKTGTTRPRVNVSNVRNIQIPLPPLPEQQKIAFVLSTIQEASEKTENVINSLKELKKSMMKHLFTYGAVSLKDAENVKLKDTEIGKLPEDWEVVKLGNVADLVMGQSPIGETYNKIGKGMPFLQGKAEFGKLYPKHIKYTTKPLRIGKKGTILMSVRAPVGDVNIANIDYCIGRGLASLSLNSKNNIFLYYILAKYKSSIELEGTGSTFKSINKPQLKSFLIPLPPLPEQQKIASILSAVDEKINAEENKKKAIDELFKSMLQNLMTAKLRVKNLEI